MAICFSPPVTLFLLPLSFFKNLSTPEEGLDISKPPIFVRFTISFDDTSPSIRSQFSLAFFKSGRIAEIWSSRKTNVIRTILALARSIFVLAKLFGSSSQDAAA